MLVQLADVRWPLLETFRPGVLSTDDAIPPPSMMSYYYYRPPLMRDAPAICLPYPDVEPSWYGDIVLLYHLSPAPFSSHFAHYFHAQSKLRVIINSFGIHLFGSHDSRETMTPAQVRQWQLRLESWFAELPRPLAPANIVLPCHMKLQ